MWLISGSFKIGAAFGIAELIYKPIQYYIHERVWYKFIRYGLVEEKRKEKKEPQPKLETQPKKPSNRKVLNYSSNR